MYRREYDTIYDTGYQLVDFSTFADENLIYTTNQYEYMIVGNPTQSTSATILLKDNLLTGTYRLSFRLYDDETMIGEVIRYIIIR